MRLLCDYYEITIWFQSLYNTIEIVHPQKNRLTIVRRFSLSVRVNRWLFSLWAFCFLSAALSLRSAIFLWAFCLLGASLCIGASGFLLAIGCFWAVCFRTAFWFMAAWIWFLALSRTFCLWALCFLSAALSSRFVTTLVLLAISLLAATHGHYSHSSNQQNLLHNA